MSAPCGCGTCCPCLSSIVAKLRSDLDASKAESAQAKESAAKEKRKREETEYSYVPKKLEMNYTSVEAENSAGRELINKAMEFVSAMLCTTNVLNPAKLVGITSAGLAKHIAIEFRSSRKRFNNVWCHAWTEQTLDASIFIDCLYRNRCVTSKIIDFSTPIFDLGFVQVLENLDAGGFPSRTATNRASCCLENHP